MTRHPSLALLVSDHQLGIALALRCRKQALGQLKPAGPEALAERAKELEAFYAQALGGHFRAEEDVLFPLAARLIPEIVPLVQSLTADHEKIRRGLQSLATNSSHAKLLFDVAELLERHIRREEKELFPLVVERLGPASASEVREKIAALAGPRSIPGKTP
ncbi:MAG TPA: hemerythrin domain-containing protein [Candidatus Acidoferrales bacterium]|nr:hemerythrin domain-containing protein [Candidatus Acidoferrales bacterium]